MYAVPSSNGRTNSTITLRKYRFSQHADRSAARLHSTSYKSSSWLIPDKVLLRYYRLRRLFPRLRIHLNANSVNSVALFRIAFLLFAALSLYCLCIGLWPSVSDRTASSNALSLISVPAAGSKWSLLPWSSTRGGVEEHRKEVSSNQITATISEVINDISDYAIAYLTSGGVSSPHKAARLTRSLGDLMLEVRAVIGGFAGIAHRPVHAMRALFRVAYTMFAAMKYLLQQRFSVISKAADWFKRLEWLFPEPERMTERRVLELMPSDDDSRVLAFTRHFDEN